MIPNPQPRGRDKKTIALVHAAYDKLHQVKANHNVLNRGLLFKVAERFSRDILNAFQRFERTDPDKPLPNSLFGVNVVIVPQTQSGEPIELALIGLDEFFPVYVSDIFLGHRDSGEAQ
ncbi:hypothetical protein [Marinomonas atlantica]|uniref:hypothetical protein n=1 Tax=Marinomonas atlantica TaxID=1806668 RepID=UPI00082CC511|nr:hypothetical protein [Marinomonas atlantica]